MAIFPTAVATFDARETEAADQPSRITALQAEVAALETALLGQVNSVPPYTAGVQGATANVIDTTKRNQFWAVDSGTGAANAVTPSAVPAVGVQLKLTYAATTGTVTMTFGSGFKPSATLAVTINHFATVEFESDGTNLREIRRSAIIAS